jgi:hypothetical protein
MIRSPKLALVFALGATLALSGAAHAAVYVFTVVCADGKKVVEQWTTDGEDPGKEFLRTRTQEKHPGCKAGDYKAATDAQLLKNTQFYSTRPEGQSSGSWVPGLDSTVGGVKKGLCGFLPC